MRRCFAWWPFPRGKGLLLRLFRPRLRRGFLVETEPGIVVRGALDDYMPLTFLLATVENEPALLLSRELIRAGDTVFDVGAHVGLWVLGAARRAGASGRVHAFEPVGASRERLLDNLALNDLRGVVVQPFALGDRAGRVTAYAASHGNSAAAALVRREGVDRPFETTLVTLDDYCAEQGIDRVDFLKVDVEGAELLVFRGGARVLASADAPVVMFEVDDGLASSFGSSPAAVKRLLGACGYGIFRVDGRRLRPVSADAGHRCEDLFALTPTHFTRHPALRARLAR